MQKKEKLDIDTDEFLRSAVQTYLIPFCLAIDPAYNVNWHHEEIAQRLEKALTDLVVHDKSTNLIIEVPPRHGKSDMASQKFPAWVLGKHPDLPIIETSYSAELAEDFGLKTRDIMELEEYQAHFETRLRPDSKAKGRWQTMKRGPEEVGTGEFEMIPARGSYTAAGVGGPITGRGFKIGIIDDPIKNREEADSEVMSEKLWGWYKSTFRTRQEGSAIKIVIITRWHQNDLVGRLLKKQQEDIDAGEKDIDLWEIIRFPAIAERDEKFRKKGDALWPWKFTISQLMKTKNALGPYEWEALYQQNPIPSEKQEFKKEWFKYYDPVDLLGKEVEYMTTVDLNVGEKNKDDEGVLATVAKVRGSPNWYLMPFDAGHFNPGETIDKIFWHATTYRSSVGLESVQYQKALRYFILEKQREKEIYFNVYPLVKNQSTAKEIRIRGLIPLYSAGVIYHLKGVHQKLENQLLSFPQGDHDDHPDALASQLEMWGTTEREEKETDESARRRREQRDAGRVSDLQGQQEPRVNQEPEQTGVLDDADIGTLGHGPAPKV